MTSTPTIPRQAPPSARAVRAQTWERRFEVPTLLAALLVIPVIVLEESGLHGLWADVAAVLNWMIWLTFFSEAALLLYLTPNRWQWVRTHPLELFVVVLTPPFLPASLQSTRVLRLLRLSRLAITVRSVRRLFSLDGLKFATILALFGIIGAGALFSAIEVDQHVSTWDGIWWAITTVTTVGYGDIYPHTTAGRIVAIALMVVGIGYVAILTGAVANLFISTVNRDVGGAENEVLARLEQLSTQVASLEEEVRRQRP